MNVSFENKLIFLTLSVAKAASSCIVDVHSRISVEPERTAAFCVLRFFTFLNNF